MDQNEDIKEVVRAYLLQNLFDSGSGDELTDSTPLISGGILDSISTLQLVSFLEEKFKIEFRPNEVDQDNLNTISRIANFVRSKSGS
jgi:acyl carrier protein